MRSNTDLDIYMLQGESPKTVMLGRTYDISQFCEHRFYDWVIFRYEPIQYLDEKIVLGRYLGPEIYVGPEMMANIMKEKSEFVHRLK